MRCRRGSSCPTPHRARLGGWEAFALIQRTGYHLPPFRQNLARQVASEILAERGSSLLASSAEALAPPRQARRGQYSELKLP